MFLRPDRDDARLVAYYVGKVIEFLGLAMLLPAAVALTLGEWNSLSALVIGASLAIITGRVVELRLRTRAEIGWSHGMLTAALAWVLGSLFAAVPLFLSGHFPSYLDAVFEGMSGLTTSGLTVVEDVDHLAYSMAMWRHLTQFIGGQGIVLAVISLFAGAAGLGTLYAGEARAERIMPNVVRTAQFIWRVALAYLLVGTTALWIAGQVAGLSSWRALYHALTIFMAAFDTGGFSPMSSSIAYYHSLTFEIVVIVLMVSGALSFGVHYQLWRGNHRELFRNIETRSLGVTLLGLATLTILGLARSGTYATGDAFFRKGLFTAVSAHTGTGFGVSSPTLFISDWGLIAPAAIVGAMALGGMASSTAGGIKAIRIGLTAKGLFKDVRQVLMPESALVVETYHSQRRRILREEQVRSAVIILLLYLISYLAGGLLGLFYGFEFTEAMFESTSATANVGLSVGIVAPDLATPLKVLYIIQMWIGRLEFMAVFALIATLITAVRGRA